MANNHGGSGSKFVSVNLNKLYGQPSHHNYPPHSGSYGPGVGTNRARPGGLASAGGGMVVLSRNRPLQKAVPKLSVPPPLNLPSLRKEYEKIDSSGAGGGAAGGAGSGSGSRPSSSGMGWTKPGNVALQEKEVGGDIHVSESVNHTEGAATKGSGTYMPPSARLGGGLGHGDTASVHHSNIYTLEKAMVLRGEDFPSLRAALPSPSGPATKQKEGSFQKVKHLVSEESSNDLRNNSRFSSPAHIQSSSHRVANGMNENGGQSPRSSNSARPPDHARKQDDPLPLIRLNPRSDWADDERDTGYGFAGRSGRDQELPKAETYWDKDFDVPRSSILPHKPPNNLSERRGQHMGNMAKGPTSDVIKPEPYRRETNLHRREDRESNSWRNSSIQEDRFTSSQVINNRNNVTVPDSISNSKYTSALGDNNSHHGYVRRDNTGQGRQVGQGQGQGQGQRNWNHSVESPRYQKSSFSKSERTYIDDSYQKDLSSTVYDERDPFTGNLVGVVKRKKEVIKQTDFHDPVRESFEAELERVQQMQEMERQRIVEEQERALEQARREEEERRRVIIEEEERRRRMEEEAREAAWRAEQERLEAIQKAEEQKIAREEEKRRMIHEEERRKQAAKQKLLELEAKIAQREAEVGKSGTCVNTGDEEVPVVGKDSDASMDSDLDNWEVSQRMVERITTSASSDSSAIDRPFDRTQFSREVSSSGFVERGKPVNPWKRDAYEVGSNSSFLLHDQENGHHSPRREAPAPVGGGRSFPRKEIYSGGGYMSSRSPFRGGIQDPDTDGFPHDHRWNSFGDGDSYGRNRDIESEFYDNVAEKYSEVGWGQGQGHSRGNNRSPYSYMNSESDKLYPYGRSRYSMKQPRVLPPPSLSSIPKSSVRGENELSAPSSSLESTARTGNYGGGVQDKLEQSDVQQEIMAQKLDKNETLRCDSQSSLSVSSPPSSPTHLSHDELDDSSVVPTGGDGNETLGHDANDEPGEVATMAGDEDEEWSLENQDEMQEQEVYDEDDDGYGEEVDEVHEGNNENVNLVQEFEHMGIEEKTANNVMDNLVLGFNEGVEVRIPGDETIETPEEKQGAVDAVMNESVVQPQNATSESGSGSKTTTMHALPSVDLPVKLQFGLFSGPSLIPSPVPAIQIGSIQMPLHLHPPVPVGVGSSMGMAHIHQSQSQPPLFQFGQLRYTSPVSQGILPPISLVQPNIHHTQFNPNRTSRTLPNQLSQETTKTDNNQSIQENWSRGLTGVTQTEEKVQGTPDNEKDVPPLSKAPGPNKGKRTTTYPPRRTFHAYDPSPSNEFQRKHRRPIQRTEFRVRENTSDRRHTSGLGSSNLDDRFKGMGASRSGNRRHMVPIKSLKRLQPDGSGSNEVKETAPIQTQSTSVEGNLKRNILEEEVDGTDAPLQSGVVRVFKQPGIECPSDEDDFIEVRSKRQMLNDRRRQQREKEIKAKSRVMKQPRKARSSVQGPNKISASLVGEASNKSGLVNKEPSTDFSTVSSQPLAPIGTPAADTETGIRSHSHTNKTLQRGSVGVEDHGSSRMFETENKAVDDAQTSLGDWGNARMDQQVIPLTQTQLDEAMKPARFTTTHVTSIGDHTTSVSEPILPSSLILTKGKSISSSSSPINSLLAGEKIQFGAVTSPTILPPSSRVVSHVIGAPGSFRPDMTQNIPKTENDCNIFFKKEDREVEVEAVAVAAIDTDEIVGSGVGPGPVLVSSTKSFGASVESIQGDQQSGSQSKPEESLSVSLPADLSVETPPISLWPPLPSPQSSSTQMLSHFHGPTPSHFPLYEMNHHHPHPHPMMSGPVFAFGPHNESGGTLSQSQSQSQSQKTTNSGSRHIAPWQNHSGMDSFYGPPAGFTGPFIGSPGVQAPPHMVVYNHYAPVGQFGQVGLSFMGATYIPSGKQPDWKHDPTSSVSRGEEEMMVSGQRPPPIQHLAPGSPLLPMGSPLTMFDVPPFQTAPDMSVQPRWSHVPASPLHAVPMSLPLQQQLQPEAMTGPSQFSSHVGHPVAQSTFPPNRFSEPQKSTPSFPDELGLVVDSSGPSISTTSAPPVTGTTTTKTVDAGGGGGGETTNAYKNQQQGNKNLSSSQQYNNNNNSNNHQHHGYGYQRGGGGVSPKNKSMGGPQWSPHRRTGTFHGRYQSMGPEKSFPPSTKVKQIYVAKQPAAASGGSSSTVG